jgi:hypothetical protein
MSDYLLLKKDYFQWVYLVRSYFHRQSLYFHFNIKNVRNLTP